MLQSQPCLVFVLRVLISSASENLRGGFKQNIHQLSRGVFSVLMHQNECIGVVGIILGLLYCFTFILGLSGSYLVFVISSPDFIRPWVCLVQMVLAGSLSSISLTRVI